MGNGSRLTTICPTRSASPADASLKGEAAVASGAAREGFFPMPALLQDSLPEAIAARLSEEQRQGCPRGPARGPASRRWSRPLASTEDECWGIGAYLGPRHRDQSRDGAGPRAPAGEARPRLPDHPHPVRRARCGGLAQQPRPPPPGVRRGLPRRGDGRLAADLHAEGRSSTAPWRCRARSTSSSSRTSASAPARSRTATRATWREARQAAEADVNGDAVASSVRDGRRHAGGRG